MRVLAATINFDHPQTGMLHALRGLFGDANVLDFDYMRFHREGASPRIINTKLVTDAQSFQPDWVWLQVQDSNLLTAEAILQLRNALPRTVVTHWTGDARPTISSHLATICRATHLTLISSVGNLPVYRDAGAARASYLQIGVDWNEDLFPVADWEPPFRVPDVVFCGSHYDRLFDQGTAEREQAIRALQAAGIDVGIVGRGWSKDFPVMGECSVKQQVHVYRRAKICLNVNHFNHLERYYSDRQLIAMGSGTPLVCRYVPGLEREFTRGEHCIWYGEKSEFRGVNPNDELVYEVRQLLQEPLHRNKLGACGRAEVIRRHTWFSRFLQVLPEIEEIRKTL